MRPNSFRTGIACCWRQRQANTGNNGQNEYKAMKKGAIGALALFKSRVHSLVGRRTLASSSIGSLFSSLHHAHGRHIHAPSPAATGPVNRGNISIRISPLSQRFKSIWVA